MPKEYYLVDSKDAQLGKVCYLAVKPTDSDFYELGVPFLRAWYSIYSFEKGLGLVQSKTSTAQVIYYMPGWMIAIIVVGSLLVVGIIVKIVLCVKNRKDKKKNSSQIADHE